MKTQTEKKLLEDRKIRFLKAVQKSAIYLKCPAPKVRFWKIRSHFNPETRAHIHLESNTICISEPDLEGMNFDEIESTAAHEVTHLYEEKHNYRFESKQADINSSLWEPSAGMMGALPEGYKPKKTKIDKRKLRPIKSRCNYHLCKKRAKTYKCKFCRKYFCSKHKTPRPPSLPLFKDTSQIAKMLMEEFHKDNAHPCFPYLHFWERQKQEERDAWGRTLDILSGKSSKNKSFVEVDTKDLDLIPDLKDLDKELKKDRKFFNKNQDINKLAIKRLKENKEEESEKKESKVWKTIKDYFKGFSF